MKIFTFVLLLVIWAAFFFGIDSLIINVLSYPKEKRYLHFRLIIVSFFTALIASTDLTNSFVVWLTKLISAPSAIKVIFTIIPARSTGMVCMLLCILILNTSYAVVHLSAIATNKKIFKAKENDYVVYDQLEGRERISRFPWKIINLFYEMDNGKPKLKNFGYMLGVSIKWMKFISLVIMLFEIVAMFLSISFGINLFNGLLLTIVQRFYLLPVALYFLFEQIQLFLEGPETVSGGSVDSVDISEKMMGDIQSLVPCYLELFENSGAILCVEAGPKDMVSAPNYYGNEAGNNQLIECKDPGLSEILFGQLRSSGIEMNFEYQNAVIQLLNGKSVFVRDNLEGEFSAYYCAYISYFASQGKCSLIICSDGASAEKARSEIEAVFENASGMNALSKISNVDNLTNDSDVNILICTYSDIADMDFILRYNNLAKRICFAILLDCDAFLDLDAIHIEVMLSKFRSIATLKNYAFVSDSGNEIVRERIQSIFSLNNPGLESFNHDFRPSNSNVMVWKAECNYNLQKILGIGGSGSTYLGKALPLSLVAIKNGFPNVYVIPGKKVGDFFFQKNASDPNSMDLDAYFDAKIDIKNVIIPRSSDATESSELKVFCVYDENFNIFDSLMKWFKYAGTTGSLIHVISPSYMLREFLAYYYKTNLTRSHSFHALYNNQLCLDHSRLLSLLAKFSDTDIEEEELLSISKSYGWEKKYNKITDLLLDAVKLVRNEAHDIYDYFEILDYNRLNRSDNKIVQFRTFHLKDKKLISDVLSHVQLTGALNNGKTANTTTVLKGNVTNYYLPKQVVALDGNYYQIESVDNNGTVVVNPSSPKLLFEYYTISDFEITSAKLVDECNDQHNIDFNIYEADVVRNIYGYISSASGNDFTSNSDYRDLTEARYTVTLKRIPVLELRIQKALLNQGSSNAKVIRLLSELFNGMFKTLYPNLYQNIIAVPNIPFNRSLCETAFANEKMATAEDLVDLFVGGVNGSAISRDDDDECVSLYIIEFSCFEYGLVKALYQNITEVLRMIYRYLSWYSVSEKGRYLHFGMDSMSPVFAPEDLLEFLSNALSMNETTEICDSCFDSFDDQYAIYKCSFCGNETRFAWKLDDGRVMCGNCHNQVKSQAQEIAAIYKEIRSNLEKIYNVSFDPTINICFQSKDAIERVAGKLSNGRVIGFYKHNPKKQLWIERKGPSVPMQSTMAHELTHAWQYAKLDSDWKELDKRLGKKNTKKKRDVLFEGHSVFVQIDIMERRGEKRFAEWLKSEYESRNDEYGKGYRFFRDYYRSKNSEGGPYTPFAVMSQLIEEILNGGDISWLEDLIK